MKLIGQSVQYLEQGDTVDDIYKQIERCARTCYKSENRIDNTAEGARKFVDRMIASKHTAMLESCSVYLMCTRDFVCLNNVDFEENPCELYKYEFNPYSKFNYDDEFVYVTTNLRVLVENNWMDDLKFVVPPTEKHEMRYTFLITTDRGVANELVRHRHFSFAQESTRYCNYSGDKFGGECTFIIPNWFPTVNEQQQTAFKEIIKSSEDYYFALLGKFDERKPDKRFKTGFKDNPLTPQQARNILPLALKTEICMTGFESDWKYFLDLRYYGKTGKPHPQMEELAGLILKVMEENNL